MFLGKNKMEKKDFILFVGVVAVYEKHKNEVVISFLLESSFLFCEGMVCPTSCQLES